MFGGGRHTRPAITLALGEWGTGPFVSSLAAGHAAGRTAEPRPHDSTWASGLAAATRARAMRMTNEQQTLYKNTTALI